MSDLDKPVVPSTFDEAVGYLKDGGGYDVAVAALFLTYGVPMPPSIVKRFRIGVGRLIDGSFDLLAGPLARTNARLDFEAKLKQDVVSGIAQAGAHDLAQNSPAISTAVALSMLNEYGLRHENKAAVARQAFSALANDPPLQDDAPETSIDTDWLNYFSDIAAQKSGLEMQRLMGRILAGEIRKPGSFSPLTINVLSTLTPAVAQKFEQLCSVTVGMNGVRFILTDVFPEFLSKGIPEIGFSYVDLLTLRSHQLLANDAGSTWTLSPGSAALMSNCERQFLISAANNGERQFKSVLLSQVGEEMHRLVSPKSTPWFIEKLSASFSQPNWNLQFIGE